MLKNHNYNLMENITVISQALYRYDTYIKDASHCSECQNIWQKLRAERENDLAMLLKELNKHMEKGEVAP